jgi:hypothetical protein
MTSSRAFEPKINTPSARTAVSNAALARVRRGFAASSVSEGLAIRRANGARLRREREDTMEGDGIKRDAILGERVRPEKARELAPHVRRARDIVVLAVKDDDGHRCGQARASRGRPWERDEHGAALRDRLAHPADVLVTLGPRGLDAAEMRM